jgi:tRNA U34 2-thiouridine synthase MnmA/TrmU
VKAGMTFDGDKIVLKLDDAQRAVAGGQSVVIYKDNICYGGGIVV